MTSRAATVEEYLEALPEDRRAALSTLRATLLKALPEGYAEGMQYGMIGYFVPHSLYPKGYHCDPKQPLPFLGLASQKNHMSLYLMCLYQDSQLYRDFEEKWKATGKKLDMGKSCVRFKKIEDVALDVVAETVSSVPVAEFIAQYEAALRK